MTKRPPSKATLRALRHARRLVNPTKKTIAAIARKHGVHWTTIYRHLANTA